MGVSQKRLQYGKYMYRNITPCKINIGEPSIWHGSLEALWPTARATTTRAKWQSAQVGFVGKSQNTYALEFEV